MYKNKKILAIIPARGGSKGLPGKNIKEISGKPLICWSIEKAHESKYIDQVFISTDSIQIKEVCEKHRFNVPELRPKKYAKDNSPSSDFIIHTLNYFSLKNKEFDYIVLMEPTSPLRKKNDIDNSIKMIIDSPNYDTLVSLGEVHMEHPAIVKRIINNNVVPYLENQNKFYQRQQLSKAFFPYGVVYISKVSYYLKNKTFYSENCMPFYIERWQNYEIDDLVDFKINEILINNFIKK